MLPDINRYIEDLPSNHTHKLALRLLNLIVQPAQNISYGVRMIILDKLSRNTYLFKLSLVVAFKEKAALVLVYHRFQNQHVRDLRLYYLHVTLAADALQYVVAEQSKEILPIIVLVH